MKLVGLIRVDQGGRQVNGKTRGGPWQFRADAEMLSFSSIVSVVASWVRDLSEHSRIVYRPIEDIVTNPPPMILYMWSLNLTIIIYIII